MAIRKTYWIFCIVALTTCALAIESTHYGLASYYADSFQGKKTASGVPYDSAALTAAHREFPFGTKVRVTNTVNEKEVLVTINDRGPFNKKRIIDLSKKAAKELAMINEGVVKVQVEVLAD
ncbi:MAG: septal ring lytic transglycosylase RlpA family protein [Saprospiraceae bacterium]|nr:septal ring lytic transglycosylase RlpA family protein [Saprospiraceae bacterium]